MTKDEFVKTFLEGAQHSPEGATISNLLGIVYDLRKTVHSKNDQIGFMDDTARDCGWTLNCRSCGESYQPDCELSEMYGSENYCGRNEFCTP
jgi:hypothetical protein